MLRQLLDANDILVIPGVYDALSAVIARQAGFKALYMTGFGVAGSLLGKPDIGLVTASEMTERARQIADAAELLPVIADGDTGYGNEYNVERLVIGYQQAGIQCIQLEDQVSPKRCGHMENKQVVDIGQAAARIAAAARARSSREFLIMARTDSRATHGLDEALRRGAAFVNAGADILFVEAPVSVAELERIKGEFSDVPLVANLVEEGKTPLLSVDQLQELGYKIALRPITSLLAVARTLQKSYQAVLTGESVSKAERLTFQAYNSLVGLDRYG